MMSVIEVHYLFSIKKEITDASYSNYNMVISIISITGHVLISEKLNHEKKKRCFIKIEEKQYFTLNIPNNPMR